MPTRGKTSKLIALGVNVAQQAVNKTASLLDKLAVDPSASSSAPPNHSYAPQPVPYPYPPGASQPPTYYTGAAPPPLPPQSYPPGAPPPPPPPPPEHHFPPQSNYSYSAHPPTHAPHLSDQTPLPTPPAPPSIPPTTPSAHYEPRPPYASPPSDYISSSNPPNHPPPGTNPLPTSSHQSSHTNGFNTPTPNLYPSPATPPPMSYSETSPSFSPSAPPQTPPAGYPQPPQPSNQLPPKYYAQPAHKSSSATCSEEAHYPQPASQSQPPYQSAPDLTSPGYDPANPSFMPSPPLEEPPPGYPKPPQPSHQLPPKYYTQPGYKSSLANSSEPKIYPQPTSHSQRPYESAPDLPSPEYDTYQPASHIHHSHSSPSVSTHHRPPPPPHASSRPVSGHDPAVGRPNISSSSPFQPAPDGYPHPSVETDSESYHTASVSPQTPFVLPSAMAGTPDCGSLQGLCPATPSVSEEIIIQSPSIDSTQMSCAAFNIVPVQIERPSETSELIMDELLEEVHKRQVKVSDSLGKLVFDEACKGLSRVLHPADDTDIQLFGIQLRRADYAACEQDYHRCAKDNIPIFAISYTHRHRGVGRFKFSESQWENFQDAMRMLVKSNVQKVRVWLDQCLWLRDSNLGCWAHTGMIPYITWPVFSLGVKAPERDRTFESFYRVWPYLEEIAGLWSMGVITISELHQEDDEDVPSPVTYIRYNQRVCLEPMASLYLLFHAICDGKITELDCACTDDVHELTDMATFHMEHELDHVVVGGNWRARTSALERQSRARRFSDVRSAKGEFITAFSSGTVYLDI